MYKRIKELHLLLIYLNSWQEHSRCKPGTKVFKSWKCYLHDILDELDAEKLILQHPHSQLILLTDKGIQKAEELMDIYGLH